MTTSSFYSGVVHGMEKASEANDTKNKDPVVSAAEGLGGLALVGGSRHAVLGTKRMYHGTGGDLAEKIMKEGLRPEFGGTGASRIGGEYVKNSRNRIHTTGSKLIAGFFSRMHKGEKGRVIKINMDYDKYLRGKTDKDMGAWMPKFFAKYVSTKLDEPVTPEEIVGSKAGVYKKIRRRMSKLPAYVYRHPIRFGTGVAATAGGAYLAQRGIKNLLRSYGPLKKEEAR